VWWQHRWLLPPGHFPHSHPNPADPAGVETPACPSVPPPSRTPSPLNISEESDPWPLAPGDPGSERLPAAKNTKTRPTSLPKKGREKLASLLADLLGHSDSVASPRRRWHHAEAKSGNAGAYESMRSALGARLRPEYVGPSRYPQMNPLPRGTSKSTVLYENCLKCVGHGCRPPPHHPASQNHHNGRGDISLDVAVGPPVSSGPPGASTGPPGTSTGPPGASTGPLASTGPPGAVTGPYQRMSDGGVTESGLSLAVEGKTSEDLWRHHLRFLFLPSFSFLLPRAQLN